MLIAYRIDAVKAQPERYVNEQLFSGTIVRKQPVKISLVSNKLTQKEYPPSKSERYWDWTFCLEEYLGVYRDILSHHLLGPRIGACYDKSWRCLEGAVYSLE